MGIQSSSRAGNNPAPELFLARRDKMPVRALK
jgi:hypothetical protein